MNWWRYVQQRVGADKTQKDIAEMAGIDPSAVSRWKRGGTPDATSVARFARAAARPVLEAFVAAGFLTAEEADEKPAEAPNLRDLPESELLAELGRRAELRRALLANRIAPIAAEDAVLEEAFLAHVMADDDLAAHLAQDGASWALTMARDPEDGEERLAALIAIPGPDWPKSLEAHMKGGNGDAGQAEAQKSEPDGDGVDGAAPHVKRGRRPAKKRS